MKQLVVNADDFGYTRDVNLGIIAAHEKGILTATTLMANGPAFQHAVALAKEHQELDIGCHLVLVGGRSLVGDRSPLPQSVPELIRRLAFRSIDPFEELRAQIDAIFDSGIRPTHLDTHKHTHLAPPILNAVARLSEKYQIRWVRRPFDFPLTGGGPVPWTQRAISQSLQVLRGGFHSRLARHGCRTTDHFAGFQLTGHLRIKELVNLLRSLPEGLTEFMCHPGYCTEELRASRTRLKQSREIELKALVAPEVRQALEESSVGLVRYRDLP